jgi:hypothetical protein
MTALVGCKRRTKAYVNMCSNFEQRLDSFVAIGNCHPDSLVALGSSDQLKSYTTNA